MPRDPRLQTICLNIPRELVNRVRTLAYNQDLSASSIVEQALSAVLGDHAEADVADRLRALGATLRRA